MRLFFFLSCCCQAVAYKHMVLKTSRTILTSPPDGRTGNKITVYANLLFLMWLYEEWKKCHVTSNISLFFLQEE